MKTAKFDLDIKEKKEYFTCKEVATYSKFKMQLIIFNFWMSTTDVLEVKVSTLDET